ncbi:hypothetical protein U1Q18_051290, partial [Sarracenia purpurea var. burkii]
MEVVLMPRREARSRLASVNVALKRIIRRCVWAGCPRSEGRGGRRIPKLEKLVKSAMIRKVT